MSPEPGHIMSLLDFSLMKESKPTDAFFGPFLESSWQMTSFGIHTIILIITDLLANRHHRASLSSPQESYELGVMFSFPGGTFEAQRD